MARSKRKLLPRRVQLPRSLKDLAAGGLSTRLGLAARPNATAVANYRATREFTGGAAGLLLIRKLPSC